MPHIQTYIPTDTYMKQSWGCVWKNPFITHGYVDGDLEVWLIRSFHGQFCFCAAAAEAKFIYLFYLRHNFVQKMWFLQKGFIDLFVCRWGHPTTFMDVFMFELFQAEKAIILWPRVATFLMSAWNSLLINHIPKGFLIKCSYSIT